jgi:HAD superfamily hydrolase (TIGR01450 family)
VSAAERDPSSAGYDALLVDLDGVVHLGAEAVPGAAEALDAARDKGMSIVFVTNNAARTAEDVASGLEAIGVRAGADEILTSSMAAADALADMLAPGSRVLVVGGQGLRAPVAAAGLTPVAGADESPDAVVQGWSPDLTWALLAEAAVAVRSGVPWIATNRDATLPSPRGPLPGNGAMVATVVTATGREPQVVGKPGPALFTTAVRRAGARRPLVVGDRLDTDIAGAVAAGIPSLLVLTGVSGPRDLLAADPTMRPTYLGRDLAAVNRPLVALTDPAGCCDDGLDGLRSLCRAAWAGEVAPEKYDAELAGLGL